MKKIVSVSLSIAFTVFTTATFAQTQTKTTATPRKTVTKTTTVIKKGNTADIAQGKELISKADCLACHKVDMKIVGPAYNDVAKKYKPTAANYAILSKKIIDGGSGNWGSVAMSPHPNVSTADAKKMVEYILSLK